MIREATPRDARAVLEIYAPFVLETPVSFEETVPTEAEMSERISASLEWLVFEDGGEVTAYAYAAAFHRREAYRWSAEVSIYAQPRARGKGIGKALLVELLDRLRSRGFVNAFAGTTLPNEASVRLFGSCGFEQVALQSRVGFKLGAWHDVAWSQLRLREPTVPPPDLV